MTPDPTNQLATPANRIQREVQRPQPDEFRTPTEFRNSNLARYSVGDDRLTDGLRTLDGRSADGDPTLSQARTVLTYCVHRRRCPDGGLVRPPGINRRTSMASRVKTGHVDSELRTRRREVR